MKQHIFNRYQRAEAIIKSQLRMARTLKAYRADINRAREEMLRVTQVKSFPQKYRDQLSATLWFCWKKDVTDHMIYPSLYHGKLYNAKWDDLPEEVREWKRNTHSNEIPYVRMWPEHFTEGMLLPENYPVHNMTPEEFKFLEDQNA